MLKELAIQAVFASVLGGVIAYVMAMLLGSVASVGFIAPIIGALLAVGLLLAVVKYTDLEKYAFLNVIILMLLIAVVGTLIVTIFPSAAGYILTLEGSTASIQSLGWSLAYVGLALVAQNKIEDML